MATNILTTKILLLNGTQADWESLKSYVLSKGEPAVEFVPDVGSETTTLTAVKVKVGDGFTTYESLPYVGEETAQQLADLVIKVNGLEARIEGIENAFSQVGNAVFQVTSEEIANSEGSTEVDKLISYLTSQDPELVLKEGNIAIVTKVITEEFTDVEGNIVPTHYSRTAYAYNGETFAALDGNYDAGNVYFDSDITYTADIGAVTLPTGKSSGTFSAKGKSVEDVIKALMALTKAPTIKQPSFSLSASASSNTTAASKEIGSYITTLKWDGTFTDGSYSYGFKDGDNVNTETSAGCTATYEIDCDKAGTASGQTVDGTWTLTDKIQIDSESAKTYATFTNKCTWSDSNRVPVNNIGDAVDGQIVSNSSTKTAGVSVTGYRNSFYYVGTDNTSVVDSEFIRNSTPRNANTTNFGIDTKTPGGNTFSGVVIPANTTRVMFAVPGTYSSIAVVNVDGMGLPEDGFVKSTVLVEGANGFTATEYTVFTKENANGMAATGFTVTISK